MPRPPHTTPSANVCVAFILVISSFATMKALSQASNLAMAKQHYEKATAAIAKNDWTTAKNELTQAKQLAPKNALVRYDLALAYSHTGQRNTAQRELTNALQLGLPAEQKRDAERLKQQLESEATTNADGTGGAEGGSPDAKLVHAMNDAIRQSGIVSSNYRAGWFTLETSSGKLWWTRITKDYCKFDAVQASVSMRLSDVNANLFQATKSDGTAELSISCNNGTNCMEDWAYPQCFDIGAWKLQPGITSSPELVAEFDKTTHISEDGTPQTGTLKFFPHPSGLTISMTGDPVAMSALTNSFSQLIIGHGGSASAPPPAPPAPPAPPPAPPAPSYQDTVSWIKSKVPLFGSKTKDVTSFSMDDCTLKVTIVGNENYNYSHSMPLKYVESVKWEPNQVILIGHEGSVSVVNGNGTPFRMSSVYIPVNRIQVDNEDLGPRVAKAFENAAAFCEANQPKSGELF